jgi:hypothetical protein
MSAVGWPNNHQIKVHDMENKENVLAAMLKAGEPLNAGKIVELTGLESKEVDKAMKQLKTEGALFFPRFCFWQPK